MALAVLSGCESEQTTSDPVSVVTRSKNSSVGLPPQLEPPTNTLSEEGVLETVFGEPGHCEDELPNASVCEWAAGADHVVVATIAAVKPDASTLVAMGGPNGWRFVSDCRLVTHALKVQINVRESYKGQLGDSEHFWIGGAQVKGFEPRLIVTSSGEPTWEKSEGKSRRGLTVGETILVALHRLDNGELSLMGEGLIGVSDAGSLNAQANSGDCLNSVPVELDGENISSLSQMIDVCSDLEESASVRKTKRKLRWNKVPSQSYAAQCNDGDPSQQTLMEVDLPVTEFPISGTPGRSPTERETKQGDN